MTRRAATITALTPWSMRLEWTEWPRTVVNQDTEPLWPVTTFMRDGSPTITADGRRHVPQPSSSTSDGAPWQPTSSS